MKLKKVVDGRLYDTETAEEVANYYNGLGGGDFRNIDESLYKTKKGAFFLAGEGGPMTKYARSCGNNSSCGGGGLFPLSAEEALAWCETHDVAPDTIVEIFGDAVQEA